MPVGSASDLVCDGPSIKLVNLIRWDWMLSCLLLDHLGSNGWFSFAPVFQWCCLTHRDQQVSQYAVSVESSSVIHYMYYPRFLCFLF